MHHIVAEGQYNSPGGDSMIRKEMEKAIVAAWASENPEVKAFQAMLFPNGQPIVEEFIAVMAEYVKKSAP